MNKRILVSFVLLVVTAGIAIWLRIDASRALVDSGDETTEEATSAFSRQSKLTTRAGVENERKRRQLIELAKRVNTSPREIDHEEAREELERKKKMGALKWKKAPELYDEMHSQESTDEQWQEQVLEMSKEFFTAEAAHGTDVVSMDCRQTLCKAIFKHDGNGAFERFHTEQSPMKAVWAENDQYGHHVDHEDGSITSILYFSRYGDHTPLRRFQDKLEAKLDEEGE
ncbi:MAG: hypothetical protein GY847_33535 [Proteobacteria bacterium]|nr:hypothetical protein [Pseudomonadota bacterium]